MARFQISYQVIDPTQSKPVIGTAIYSGSHIGQAIDAARINLADEVAFGGILSYTITDAKAVR